jgi:replication initiation and membrane attachment protein DnaB
MAALLEDPSWTEEDLKKLAGLNLLRVFRAVEEVRSGSVLVLIINLPVSGQRAQLAK